MTVTDDWEFDPLSDSFFNDPYPIYQRMRDEAPVYYNERYDFYALSRHDDVTAAFKNYETFSSKRGTDLENLQSDEPKHPIILMMDPPDHRRMRQLVSRVFTPRAIAALEPMIRGTAQEYLAACDPNGFDIVEDFAALFPVTVITRMLGVPDGMSQQVRLWLEDAMARDRGVIATPQKGKDATVALWAMFFGLIQERRSSPQDDMITDLLRAEVTREDGTSTSLSDMEVAGFLVLLSAGGSETTTKLIANAMVTLHDNPEMWRALGSDRVKLPTAVDETLRHQPPAQFIGRFTTRDVELHGTVIPAESAVLLMVAAANRDERVFNDPDRFDFERTTGSLNTGFGYGVHSCLGAALARLETRVALDLLLDLMPEYEVEKTGLKRVEMTNVIGWSQVPARRIRL